jgi:septum formation protein
VRVVLASASPRRRELLHAAGVEVDVDPADVDETREPDETPAAYVERLARLKAAATAVRHPAGLVLGADTTVTVDGDVLAKPRDPEDAAWMLRRLSGRTHDVLTGVAVVWQGRLESFVETTAVTFAGLSEDDIVWYVSSGEPLDKAGAYAIQGLASRFVPRISGSYSNVVGLPVAAVLQLCRRIGAPVAPSLLRSG